MSPNTEWHREQEIDELNQQPMEHPLLDSGGELEVGKFELDTLADLFETQTSRPQNSSADAEEVIESATDEDTINLALEEDFDELLKKASLQSNLRNQSKSNTSLSDCPPEDLAAWADKPLFGGAEDDFSDLLSVPNSSGIDSADSTISSDLGDLFGYDFSFEDSRADPTYPSHSSLEDLNNCSDNEDSVSSQQIESDCADTVSGKTTSPPSLTNPQVKLPPSENSEFDLEQLALSLEATGEAMTPNSSVNDFDSLFEQAQNNDDQPIDLDSILALNTPEQDNVSLVSTATPPTLDSQDSVVNSTPQSVPEQPKTSTENSPEIIRHQQQYFEQFEQLENLLEQPFTQLNIPPQDSLSFAQLEALIEQPYSALLPPQSSPGARENVRKTNRSTLTSKEVEDEFEDLEQLLNEIQHEVGVTPTGGNFVKPNRSITRRNPQVRPFEQTLKVAVKQLDNLSNLVGELVVNRNGLEQDQEQLRQSLDNLLQQVGSLSDLGARMQDLYERTLLERSLLASRRSYEQRKTFSPSQNGENAENEDYDPLEMDSFTGFHLLSQEMIEMIVRVKESTSDIALLVDESDQVTRNLRQTTTKLQEGIKNARMVPFARTADRLPVAVRRISQKLKKQAEVQIEGRETLIDKMILEHLSDPMTHLVNNALYHGVESPQLRMARNKPPVGLIKISAYYQGNQTVIKVSDDGAGIDPQKVKAKALERGLIKPHQIQEMADVEVYELLFHAGFSIKDQADDFAGRGVGMDVVRTSISEIRGTVSIDSVLGEGTSFTIRLPLTLSICPALFCLSDRARIAFPMDGVEDTQDFPPDQIQLNEQGERCVSWRETVLPIKPLPELISYNRQIGRGIVYGGQQEEELISIVVLRSGGNFLAVQVDQVLEQQEIVIKQLNNGPVPSPPGIAGATILGDGSVMAIADVIELLEIAQGRMRKDSSTSLWENMSASSAPEDITSSEPMVLIVDDSITVRELLKTTFSNAGYRVEQARDGQEAWEKLRSGLPCNIVFCDIEMPRMDGLELLERMSKDGELSQIPIAMLTSRGAERHKNVAAERGASGYFTKPYTEKELLDAAQRMMAGEVLLVNSSRLAKATLVAPPVTKLTLNTDTQANPKVLIVDDSVTVRQLLTITFESEGYLVQQARDGQDAWEKLNSDYHYDLILCDIEMPRMDGLTLLSQLQKHAELSQIPVAMLTSRGAQKHRQIAAQRGAKGYFTKPYTEKELLSASQSLIQGEVLLQLSSQGIE